MSKQKSKGVNQNHIKKMKLSSKVEGVIIGGIAAIIGFLIGKYL